MDESPTHSPAKLSKQTLASPYPPAGTGQSLKGLAGTGIGSEDLQSWFDAKFAEAEGRLRERWWAEARERLLAEARVANVGEEEEVICEGLSWVWQSMFALGSLPLPCAFARFGLTTEHG